MNLTGQPVYQKDLDRKRKGNRPTQDHRAYWERVRSIGCIVCGSASPEIHHCGTGGGGRKDHMKVIPLCKAHHRGEQGIHTLSRRVWEPIYGSEVDNLARVARLLTSASAPWPGR